MDDPLDQSARRCVCHYTDEQTADLAPVDRLATFGRHAPPCPIVEKFHISYVLKSLEGSRLAIPSAMYITQIGQRSLVPAP